MDEALKGISEANLAKIMADYRAAVERRVQGAMKAMSEALERAKQ